jgi:pimeloyl-ACP methyl ester carboxylesterase
MAGFKHKHIAEVMSKPMLTFGYDEYIVQGSDWGSDIARMAAVMFPKHVKALHQNMLMMAKSDFASGDPEYSDSESIFLKRFKWFQDTNAAYNSIQNTKPNTLGFAMHDSPVAVLACVVDKLFLWADEYPWTPTEIITWTLLHYFTGPTTSFPMYLENILTELMKPGSDVRKCLNPRCSLLAGL